MTDDLFASGGETGRLMAALDWSRTDLGPVSGWPQSLRAAVRIVLSSRYPMLLLWGPGYTQLYNDAYSALIGDRHPAALGLDVRITLAEGWDVLAPLISEAMATGVASWVPALQLLLNRSGYREEAYFSVSHAPARDDDGATAGVLTVCSEVTEQVVGERRLRLLREVSLPSGAGLDDDITRTCARLCEVIGEHPLDVPFAAVYLRQGMSLHRVAATGAAAGSLPAEIHDQDHWGVRAAAASGTVEVTEVGDRMTVPAGPWGDPVRVALAQPLPSATPGEPVGVLLAGVSPSRALDGTYRSFFTLLGQQVAVAVRTARAYQEERARAAALAELDRAKTDFFTNVSHEFRTPLTLMLGPLADALGDETEPLGPAQRERVDTAWRNAGRMLVLVNDLLAFSRVEAGRARATPAGVDLPAFTRELAAVFRSAIERAGLRLVVDCPPLPKPVAVDPEHWERIVTNLLSNALKFTFVGEIRVTLHAEPDAVHLSVTDTGIGVDPAELPHLFDRFHRVRGARSRSHEGTGIGLALVRELTRLQGGHVTVDSVLGEGSTFTVTLPWQTTAPANVPEATAPETAGREAAGPEAAGREAGAPEASRPEAAGREAAGPEAAGRETAGREAGAPEAAGPEAAGREAAGRETAGREAGAPEAAGPEAASREAAGPEAAAGVEPLAVARTVVREVAGWLDEGGASGAGVDRRGGTDAIVALTAEATPGGAYVAGPEETAARIMVADDNADMRAYLTRLLTAQGWSVRTAGDGETALRTILADPPDLLITDVMMPRSDGFTLVRALRRERATQSLPIVMLSARAGGESGVEGLDAGADDYIVKPFAAADLIARVRNSLRLARVRAAARPQPAAEPPPPPRPSTAPSGSAPAGPAPSTVPAELASADFPPSTVASDRPRPADPAPADPAPAMVPSDLARSTVLADLPRSTAPSGPASSGPASSGPAPSGPASSGPALVEVTPDKGVPAVAAAGGLPVVDVVWTYPLGPGAAAAVRNDLRAVLSEDKIDLDLLYDLQIATTEAVNNAVEHAQEPSRPYVEVRLRTRDGLIRIEVQDFGVWRARPPARDRGRGAVLMNAFGDVRVTPSPTGTLVTIERHWTT